LLKGSKLLLLIIALLLVSCGKRSRIRTTCRNPLENPTSSTKKVKGLVANTNGLVAYLNKRKFGLVSFVIVEPQYTPINPLVLSEAAINRELQEINAKIVKNFPPKIQNWLLHGSVSEFEEDELDRVALQEMVSSVSLLQGKSERWNNYQCSLGELALKTSDDVSVFYQLDKKDCQENSKDANYNPQCLEFMLKNWSSRGDFISAAERLPIEGLMTSMCGHFNSTETCQRQFLKHVQKGNLTEYYHALKESYRKEKYNTFFSLAAGPRKFKCNRGNNGVVEMTIPFLKTGAEDKFFRGGLAHGLLYAEKIWSNSKFKMKFNIAASGDSTNMINLNFQNGITSSVSDESPTTINLNAQLAGTALLKTVSHEFGHVLGFPDCYIEYYQRSKKEIIYYELEAESQNLMCSHKNGWKIPDSYFEQLVEQSCLF
jgi:hypothetical protein